MLWMSAVHYNLQYLPPQAAQLKQSKNEGRKMAESVQKSKQPMINVTM